MASKTEPNRLNDVLRWEQKNMYSREKVTVLSGEVLAILEVIGAAENSTPATGTADGGNTGNGTCTGVAAGTDTQIGDYVLECVSAVADAGVFEVTSPDGDALPDAIVAVAYTNTQLNFTLNDGATDFVVGDKFTVTVAAGSGKVVPIDFTAVDGSQKAAGFMIAGVDASAADTAGVAIVRDAIIVSDDLVWPAGATADQKAQALAEMKGLGIVTRDAA